MTIIDLGGIAGKWAKRGPDDWLRIRPSCRSDSSPLKGTDMMKQIHNRKRCRITVVFMTSMLASGMGLAAVTVGQVDDFQDGTEQGWVNGLAMATPPFNQANAGPAGTGDNALFSLTGGSPDTFSIVNSTQWAGDYNAAGITAITLDISNLGPNNFDLGILVNGGSLITNSVFVPSGSGWISRTIDLSSPVFGSTTTLSLVSSLELVSLQGGTVTSVGALDVFVDNIRAIPEPSVAIFGLFAIASLTLRRQRAS